MFCHKCGTELASDTQFCTTCGTALAEGAQSLTVAPAAQWAPPPGFTEVRAGHWIGQGWELVKADMLTYVLLAVVFTVISGAVPVILQGPMIAGLHIFTMKKLVGKRAEFSDLFRGF